MTTALAKRLKEARERIDGLTQDLAGEKLGITGKAISGWEAGRGGPARWRLQKIAMLYRVNLLWLLEGEGPRESSDPVNEFLTHPHQFGVDEMVGNQLPVGSVGMTAQKLVDIFRELDEEGRNKLMAKAYELLGEQTLARRPLSKDRSA